MGGTYTLLIGLERDLEIEVGALGEIRFESGYYAYTGSARGSGGYERIERHRRVAEGGGSVHWHVDYLNGHPATEILEVVKSGRRECGVAGSIDAEVVPGFGSSDCDCTSHLHYGRGLDDLLDAVRNAHVRR